MAFCDSFEYVHVNLSSCIWECKTVLFNTLWLILQSVQPVIEHIFELYICSKFLVSTPQSPHLVHGSFPNYLRRVGDMLSAYENCNGITSEC